MTKLLGDFLYILAEADDKPVEVLRTGTFTDRNGREVAITEDDLDAYVSNFTAGAAGQDVPIDIDHERAEAGGWVKRLERQGDKLLAYIDWNEYGRKLVGDKLYKYLSATIDTAAKIIKSVSLVNFPAVKGLRAVELTQGACTFQQAGFFDAIKEMLGDIMKRDRVAELADGTPGTVTISQYLQAATHKTFTNIADNLALAGYLSEDERKQLSAAIGAALEMFAGQAGDAAARLVPAPNFWPGEHAYSEPKVQDGGAKPMDEKELEAMRNKMKAELEAELAQQVKTEAELKAKVKAEVEAELKARFERRQGLVEFARQICGGDAGLSAKPEDVVEFLEALPDDQVEKAKGLLQAKVVQFREVGHGGDDQAKKPPLPELALGDVRAGKFTVKELFDARCIDGKPEEYDLSEFDARQKGF